MRDVSIHVAQAEVLKRHEELVAFAGLLGAKHVLWKQVQGRVAWLLDEWLELLVLPTVCKGIEVFALK